jgi:hypothetical protein
MRDSHPDRPKARSIVVYYNGTFVHLRNGAHMRMTSLLRYLTGAGHDVTLFSFANHPTEPWTEEAQALLRQNHPGVRLVLDEQTPALNKLTSSKNARTSFFPAKSRDILAKRIPGVSPNYEKLVAEKPDALWIVNYADGLTQLNGLPSGPIVVETHDLKFVNVAKKNNASPFNIRSLLRMRSELGVLETVAGLIAISPVEAGFFRTVLAGPRTFYIPQYCASRPVHRAPKPEGGYRYDLLFVGSDMFQNSRGLLRFCRENADWLPGLRIAVVGKVGEDPEVRAYAADKPYIELLGFVDDIAAVHAASKAAISPVDGTGLKIKVIDALGFGVPVFGSPHTLEGLAPGFEACAFPITRDRIEPLLKDEARLDMARQAAITYWESLPKAGDIGAFGDFLKAEAKAGA